MNKIAVYAGTRGYYTHMLPAFTSLLLNSSVDEVHLLVEDVVFPARLPHKVIVHDVSTQIYFPPSGINFNTQWTYMAMMKLVLPWLFNPDNKILYLDVDTIVTQNIDELWEITLGDNYFGAVREEHKSSGNRSYFNSGVLLVNSQKLLEGKYCMVQRLVDALNMKKYSFPDQDCMNELCSGKILELPGDYNVTWFNTKPTEEKIIHYAAVDKWDQTELYQKYLKIYEEDFCKI